MLAGKHFDLYPSVERLIINYLVYEDVDGPGIAEACWSIVQDQSEGIVREFAARYVGRFGELGDGARLRELFERESNQEFKRALLIALYESGTCPDSLLRSLSNGGNRLGITARYLRSSPQTIPCPNIEVSY
jgi:hypothetical protein